MSEAAMSEAAAWIWVWIGVVILVTAWGMYFGWPIYFVLDGVEHTFRFGRL